MVFLFVLITFDPIIDSFGKIQKSKMADQDGHHSEMITQLLRHVRSSPHDADIKGDIFRPTIYPRCHSFYILGRTKTGGGEGCWPAQSTQNYTVNTRPLFHEVTTTTI